MYGGSGFHLEILSRGGKSGDHRNKRGQQQKQSLSNVESCVCMTSNVSSENCHYFDVYMEHEEHVYFRKDRSVQQGVVREGDVPPPARSAKLKLKHSISNSFRSNNGEFFIYM